MKENIKTLQQENSLLKTKLKNIQKWMKRGVYSYIKVIEKQKVAKIVMQEKKCFLNENIDEIVTEKIQDFFGEIMLINIPYKIIENIISAEINYYNFRHNPQSDGFAVISSYHKALDIIIEEYIVIGFRKFYIKKNEKVEPENNSLEKALYSVIHKNYNLSAGRLFHMIQTIREMKKGDVKGEHYIYVFYKYIKKYNFILKTLIEDNKFYKLFERIIETEVLGSKRHSGRIDFVETREARKILIGNFKEKECLIYKLVELAEV